MNDYIPNMYYRSILDIDYKLLQNQGIKYLIFDLDNTLSTIDKKEISNEYKEKLNKLSKKFKIIIVSNNFSKKIKPLCDSINMSFISFAMKPLPFCYKKVLKKWKCQKDEVCMIGDQLLTDIKGANKFGILSILVDPLGQDDIKYTGINRLIENKIISKSKMLKRGTYYERR